MATLEQQAAEILANGGSIDDVLRLRAEHAARIKEQQAQNLDTAVALSTDMLAAFRTHIVTPFVAEYKRLGYYGAGYAIRPVYNVTGGRRLPAGEYIGLHLSLPGKGKGVLIDDSGHLSRATLTDFGAVDAFKSEQGRDKDGDN